MTGCGPSEDARRLRPYRNIPPGTAVVVLMRVSAASPYRSWELIFTNEYVLEGFDEDSVRLRATNGMRASYAGRMIKSIQRKEAKK